MFLSRHEMGMQDVVFGIVAFLEPESLGRTVVLFFFSNRKRHHGCQLKASAFGCEVTIGNRVEKTLKAL
jgi:hypothetical protein